MWGIAAVISIRSASAAVLALLIGGAAIHPVGMLLAKGLGRAGAHARGNPLGRLALEGTAWMLAGIVIALGLQLLRAEWFFPAMLLVIGGRYLTFQTLYGLRIFWLLGAILAIAGLSLGLARAPVSLGALAGASIEIVFALVIFGQARRAASG